MKENNTIIVVSDFHLKFYETTEENNSKVLKFLRSIIGKADVLILNGDIFDLWYTWKTVIIKGYFDFLKVLADIQESLYSLLKMNRNLNFNS